MMIHGGADGGIPKLSSLKNKKKKKTMIDCRPSHTSWSSPETRIIMPLAAIGKLTSFFSILFLCPRPLMAEFGRLRELEDTRTTSDE